MSIFITGIRSRQVLAIAASDRCLRIALSIADVVPDLKNVKSIIKMQVLQNAVQINIGHNNCKPLLDCRHKYKVLIQCMYLQNKCLYYYDYKPIFVFQVHGLIIVTTTLAFRKYIEIQAKRLFQIGI